MSNEIVFGIVVVAMLIGGVLVRLLRTDAGGAVAASILGKWLK